MQYKVNILIGRSTNCDVVISSPRVSNQHCRLKLRSDGHWCLEDLRSTNGTIINGRQLLGEDLLGERDLVYIGDTELDWQGIIARYEQGAKFPTSTPSHQKVDDSSLFEERTVVQESSALRQLLITLTVVLGIGGGGLLLAMNSGVIQDSLKDDLVGLFSDVVKEVGDILERGGTAWKPKNENIEYDYSCMQEGSLINTGIQVATGVSDAIWGAMSREIDLEDEMEVGKEVKENMIEEYSIWENRDELTRCQNIFNELISAIEEPKGYDYELMLIDEEVVNAFTAGGKVFITRGMIEFVENDDEIAAVLGHEIYHNELGHIREKLQKHAVANDLFGDFDFIPLLADQILMTSFNQKNEVECDLHGLDLAVAAGYNGCVVSPFWERMGEGEDDSDFFSVMRSHPYSRTRSSCVENHIDSNYDEPCSN